MAYVCRCLYLLATYTSLHFQKIITLSNAMLLVVMHFIKWLMIILLFSSLVETDSLILKHFRFFYGGCGKRVSGWPDGKQPPLPMDIQLQRNCQCVTGLWGGNIEGKGEENRADHLTPPLYADFLRGCVTYPIRAGPFYSSGACWVALPP